MTEQKSKHDVLTCPLKNSMNKRTKCERYSRVVGYLRPREQWNEGKQAEWDDRVLFNVKENC